MESRLFEDVYLGTYQLFEFVLNEEEGGLCYNKCMKAMKKWGFTDKEIEAVQSLFCYGPKFKGLPEYKTSPNYADAIDNLLYKTLAFCFQKGDFRPLNTIADLEEKIENCYFADFDDLTNIDKERIMYYRSNSKEDTLAVL